MSKTLFIRITLIAILLMTLTVSAIEIEKAPYRTGVVMINGYFHQGEWSYPPVFKYCTENGVDIRIQHDSLYIYIGLNDYAPWITGSDIDTNHTGVDLYIDDTKGNIRLLHISSALGEKVFSDGVWSDMNMAEHFDWTGSMIQSIYVDNKQKYVGPDNFEFQISKKLLPEKSFKMMIQYKRPGKIAPPDASTDSSESWMTFNLGD